MDERSDQIVDHIERQRNELGRNLDELQNKVRDAADWRSHFDKHPAVMIGIALGGGMLLGAMAGGSHIRGYSRSPAPDYSRNYSGGRSLGSGFSLQRQRAGETLDNVKGALVGFGIAQLKQFLTGYLPDFDRHYEETARKNASEQSSNEWRDTPVHGSESAYAPRSSESSYSSPGSYGTPGSAGAGQQPRPAGNPAL